MNGDQEASAGTSKNSSNALKHLEATFFPKKIEWSFGRSGRIIKLLEAADANPSARWAETRRARWHPSRLAKLKKDIKL
jgi:hypothetical protein